MKFSRLKILGFKSFCDVAELQMEAGITGVVGPNGCGKSNLVEALRWVMGESSYKAMRASGMDDVIFSGSKNRPSRNSAEVTLFLDNKDRSAPNQFNSEDEIEITRRIERESGSSYRINGRDVRARDVQLLFADASTGAKSPALVKQGQIGELIAAKPTQRRALLEEAAGISGLHSRRHEAELKLRATEANLERIDDVVAQVESQLDTLKRQARLATRYRNISGDIHKSEATLYHIRWVKARLSQKENEAMQGRAIAELADKTSAQLKAQKQLEETEQRLEPLRNEEVKVASALQRFKIQREQLNNEEKRANYRQHELKERQKQIIFDGNRERELTSEANDIISSLQNEKSLIEKENQKEETAASEAKAKVAKSDALLIQSENDAKESANLLAQITANKESAKRILLEAKQRLERLQNQKNTIKEEIEQIDISLRADKTISEKEKNLQNCKDDFSKAEVATKQAEENLNNIQNKLEEIRPELATLEQKLSAKESEAKTLEKVLNVEGQTLWPSIVDSLIVETGFETALGAALGQDLEASSDKGAPLHWEISGSSKNDAELPNGAISIAKYVSGSELLTRRLKQIGIVSKEMGEKLMPSLISGQLLVSKQGDIWRWDGFVSASDAPTASAQRLAQRNRLKELDLEIKNAKDAAATLQKNATTLSEEINAARQNEIEQREKWSLCQRAITFSQSELELAKSALTDLNSKQSALKETLNLVEENIVEAKTQHNDAEAKTKNQLNESEAAQKAKNLQSELEEIRQQNQNAKIHLSQFENQANLRNTRQNQIEIEIQNWQKRSQSAKKQLDILDQRNIEISEQLKILQSTPDNFSAKRLSLDEDIEALSEDYKTASDRLALAQTNFREADKKAKQANDNLSSTREQLARIDERLKSSISLVQQIEQIVLENLSIAASKTAQIANIKPDAPLPSEEIIEKKLNRLKAERERLGGVNLGAEKEAKEITEKLGIMIADKEDLINAIAKLRTGIFSLNKEGRARLNDAFDKVNSHFKELFTSLFNGGEAELKFVESDDPLHAGLEIIARPPGKKPQILTLLSGGEQALTALALIFAVFLTNPAPICVLDEVDAPLDDANVIRFCNLLDDMNKRTNTRFLVITHNPITMSRTDRLFGVTMAQRGISQLVSVDLNTARSVVKAS